jgi:hypothetical protein
MGHNDELAGTARKILANRRSRLTTFPSELFSEWAWEALLLLFVADTESRPMTGWMIAHDLACAPPLMARWIKYLASAALITGDGHGHLDDPITLSPSAITMLERYLAETVKAARLIPS